MPIISAKDLDTQMGRGVDPASVQQTAGGSQGAMEARFQTQGGIVEQPAGHGQRGTLVYDPSELPGGKGFYGSGTVISVNDAPPLDAVLEPERMPAPEMPAALVAQAPAQAAPARPRSAADILAQYGLKPKA